MRSTEAIDAARRAMEICRSCRYCEGYCVVFQVMELRQAFNNVDLGYLADLCHNCRNCYYACQYAPPHDFAINLPKIFSQVRGETYEHYAWPRPLGRLLRRNGVVVSITVAAAITIALILTLAVQSPAERFDTHFGPGAFYAVVPGTVMASVAGVTLGLSLVSMTISLVSFWRDLGGRVPGANPYLALSTVIGDVITLRHMSGGGHGCNDRDESLSSARRYFHHAVFYGFLLCCASTAAASIYEHLLDQYGPYPPSSLPVMLGAAGGLSMMVGAIGLALMKMTADPNPTAGTVLGGDYALLGLLLMVAGSGLALLVFRETVAMSVLLAIHLGAVFSFFLLLPYSKLVHGGYRAIALLRAAMERQASR
jgi:citrate/tricarballylate utilization protein